MALIRRMITSWRLWTRLDVFTTMFLFCIRRDWLVCFELKTAYDISVCLEFRLVFFFFQAEDGIRDHCVTGVQTCALPISPGTHDEADIDRICLDRRPRGSRHGRPGSCHLQELHGLPRRGQEAGGQIGRASCRERV